MKTAALIAFLYMTLLGVTETNFSIMLAAIPLILTSLGSLVVSLRNSFKADRIENKVDGNMSKMQTDLAIANGRIEQLLRFYPQKETHLPEKVEVVNSPSAPVPITPITQP